MPSYIYKFGPDEYVEWSTIVDAPVSTLMTREEMAEYLFREYGHLNPAYHEIDKQEIEKRLQRTDEWNSSAYEDMGKVQTPKDLVSINRAGPREGHLTAGQILAGLREERRLAAEEG